MIILAVFLSGCKGDLLQETQPETVTSVPTTESVTRIAENQRGTVDGYDYELWKDYGTTEMHPLGVDAIATVPIGKATYDIYKTQRVNLPSIDKTQTFQQHWSVQKGKRAEYVVCLTDHFRVRERLGLKFGKPYETALTVEGYQSSGIAEIYRNEIRIEP